MRTVITIFLIAISCSLIAQNSTISGKVLDKSTGEPIEYATVTLYQSVDSTMLDGVVTNEQGLFQLEKPKNQNLYLQVQFMGYETYSSEAITGNGAIDLGTIQLGINAANLAEIEVTGKHITEMHKLDKQTFDAGQFENAKGGTASDVLANLPSVSVNSFGEISVRGATGFLVMINGKPIQGDVTTILQQLSANSIEDIEIITAPSAKYDADGKAGIINIKTKQGMTDGFFLNANVLLGLPSIEPYDNKNKTSRYGADVSLNYKNGKWDFAAGLNYRRYDISGRREGYVNTYLNEVLTEFPSDGERSFDDETYAARLAASYKPTKNQTITAGFYAGKRTKNRTADILYQQQRTYAPIGNFVSTEHFYDLYIQRNELFSEGTQIQTNSFFNENLRVRKGDFLIGSLDYALQLNDGSELSFSGLYERTVLGGPTDNVSLVPNSTEILQLQFNDNYNPLDGIRFQTDYKKKLGEVVWESGYQYKYLNHPGDFVYNDKNLDTDTWVSNPLFTNSIKLVRSVHAVYTQFSGKSGKLEYKAGLRGEYFDRSVKIANPDSTYNLEKLNLFPSVNLGYDLGNEFLLKAGYSKRIERTTTFKMTPFPEREHSETLEQGDVELLPEYIDLAEVGIVKKWNDNSFFATAYYRHVDNLINRVNTVFNDTILNRIYTNVGVANAIGFEVGTTLYPTKWWKIYLGGNVYNYQIKGELFQENINTSNVIYSINANTNVTFSPTFSMQIALNYLSEQVTAQGSDSRFYNPSLSLRKTFLDKKMAISLQWQNIDLGILNSNEQRITTVRNEFYTTTNYVYEVDIVQLNFTYQLNQPNKKMNLPSSEFGKEEF